MHWLLEEVIFFEDGARNAALNMAMDEALLEAAEAEGRAILRVYGWERRAVSFGYFGKWAEVRAAYPGREAVRRWTGGGVVEHGEDFTYALLIPRGVKGWELRPTESYAAIQGAVRAALEEGGVRAWAADGRATAESNACFEKPVEHDVMAGGRKVAGAAQRRTRRGLLHQGSIQGLALPGGFGRLLAGALAGRVEGVEGVERGVEERAAELAGKYGSPEWLERY